MQIIQILSQRKSSISYARFESNSMGKKKKKTELCSNNIVVKVVFKKLFIPTEFFKNRGRSNLGKKRQEQNTPLVGQLRQQQW